MPNKLRQYQCEDCGRLTRRNRKSNDPRVCKECGRDRVIYRHKPWARPQYTPDPPQSCAR